MCYTEDGGSSFWFMTNPSDCGAVTDYFRELGHELDWEDHVATIDELAKASFDVHIWEQKLGDLVLVPPRRCVAKLRQPLTLTNRCHLASIKSSTLGESRSKHPGHECQYEVSRSRCITNCRSTKGTRFLSSQIHRRTKIIQSLSA